MLNELTEKFNSNKSLILNMDESSGSGTHWTCVFITETYSYYFDFFG